MIYLDNAATTYPKPECLYDAMDYAQRNLAFNAGRGSYEEAKKSHEIIEETRAFLCAKANAKNLIFTPSATHALNMIVSGLHFQKGEVVYISPYDHNAIVRTLYENAKIEGFEIKIMPLNDDYSIGIEELSFNCMKDKPKAIFCTHVSNVTGYILPIKQIGEIAKQYCSTFIVDGAQAFGLVDVDLQVNNIDYYVIAGHKTLNGPFGIAGFLTRNKLISLTNSFYGGTGSDSLNVYMPNEGTQRFEPSSPNVVAIYGLLKSAKWTFDNNGLSHEKELYNYAIERLEELNDVIIYKAPEDSNTGILSINVQGYKSGDVAKILYDDFGIAVRSDYHCCPFIHEVIGSTDFSGTLRISISMFNTKSDISMLCDALDEIIMEG